MQQSQPVRWGGPQLGPQETVSSAPATRQPRSCQADHWMMSDTAPHPPITPASSHRCEPGHPRCPAMLSKCCQHQLCPPRAAGQPGNHTDSRACGITVLGVFCGGLLCTKLTGTPLPQGESRQCAPAQEGQANRLTGMRLAEATGNLQPTFPQTGAPLHPRLATCSSPRPVLEASPSVHQWHRAPFLSESVFQCSNHLSHPEFCSQKELERQKTNLHLRVEA